MRLTISVSGRPLSLGMRLNSLVTAGVKLRISRFRFEEDRRYLGAAEQIIEVAVGPVQFFDLVAELVINGLQFLIDRLQFLL
jgi:hypothetical protein